MSYTVMAVSEDSSVTLWDGRTRKDKSTDPHTFDVFVGPHTFEVGDKVLMAVRLVHRPEKDPS